MKRVISQELIWYSKNNEWIRRSVLDDSSIIWEDMSQYGTFKPMLSKKSVGIEEEYVKL